MFYNSLRTVVISPPVEDFYFTAHRFCGAGSKIVANLLRKKGLQVTEFNFPSMAKKGSAIPLPQELSYLHSFIEENETGKASFFRTYKRFGPSIQQCSDMVCELKPDLCFISVFAFCYASTALDLAKTIKKRNKDSLIVFGGAGVSVYPQYFLKREQVDFTLSGEAEVNVCDFIDYILTPNQDPDRISGLGWKSEGKCNFVPITRITSSNEILCPVIKTTESKTSATFSISLSRGCAQKCKFCSNWICHGNKFRRCSQDQINTIIWQIKEANIPEEKTIHLNFEDDNLLIDYDFWIETIKSLKSHFRNISFSAENGIDYRLLNISNCKELIEMGFTQFNISLGSVSGEINRSSERSGNLQHYSSLLKVISGFNIPVITYFICGFKEDTLESIARNLAFLSSKDTLIGISLFYPVPGIAGYENREIFDQKPSRLCCGSSAFPWNKSLSTQTMITAFRLCRIINLSKLKSIDPFHKQLLEKFFSTKRLYTLQKTASELKVTKVSNQDYDLVSLYLDMLSR
jgi:radical SAM superfamily enzyme YgiQ (UPF0313 family)